MNDNDIWNLKTEPLETKTLTSEEINYLTNFSSWDLFSQNILPISDFSSTDLSDTVFNQDF